MLIHGVHRLMEADWAVVIRNDEVIAQVGDSPDVAWLVAFLMGAEHLTELDEALPDDLVWGHLIESRLAVAAGRSGHPIHERERVRVSLLARLADALM